MELIIKLQTTVMSWIYLNRLCDIKDLLKKFKSSQEIQSKLINLHYSSKIFKKQLISS